MSTLLYEWNDAWSVGNEKLDSQHKTLLKLFNDLHELAKKGKYTEKIEEAVDFLLNYAKEHFSYEEKYFINKKFPEASSHCEMHKVYIETVTRIKKKYDAEGATVELAIEIADFGADWLINHMKSVDKKYCQFILKGKCPK